MCRGPLRAALLAMMVAAVVFEDSLALAQDASVSNETDVDMVEHVHRESIATRRRLATSVLVAGGVSVAGGAGLMIPTADDQAWRFAGINTAVFGAVNTVVALFALSGIGSEEDAWESTDARASRRTPEGLARAKTHAATDERRESVGHAINLGLGGAYLGVAGTAVVASQLGVNHPNRWLASGAAIAFQSLFLIGVDFIGLKRSQHYHGAFVKSLMPTFTLSPAAESSELRLGVGGRY